METPTEERNAPAEREGPLATPRPEHPVAATPDPEDVPTYQRPELNPDPLGLASRVPRTDRSKPLKPEREKPERVKPERLKHEPTKPSNGAEPAVSVAPPPASDSTPARLMALDAFRGLTVGLMLVVNNAALGSATPDTLVHASFGSAPTLADLVFPWFLLAVGIAIPFSAASKRDQGQSHFMRIFGAVRRTVSLYLAGVLVDSSIRHEPYFGLGVLQLIALAYLVGRLLYYLPAWLRVIVAGGCLWWYGWALTSLSLFNYQTGSAFTEEQNFVHYLNENLLAPYRMQGIMSVVPTACLVLLGSLVGDVIRIQRWVPGARASLVVTLGAVLVVIGTLWGHYLPMNKPYWTPPYILYAGGWGILALSFFFIVADIFGGKFWPLRLLAYPMVVFGSNALVAYAGAILVKIHILQEWTVNVGGKAVTLQTAALDTLIERYGRESGGWLYTLGYLAVAWVICAFLYHRRAFVRA